MTVTQVQVQDRVEQADPLLLLGQVICDSIDDLLIRGTPTVVPLPVPARISGVSGACLAVSVACPEPGHVLVQVGSGRLVVFVRGQSDTDRGELTGVTS